MQISIVIIILIRFFGVYTAINSANAQNDLDSSNILTHRKCFVVAESSVYSMINKPMEENCVGFVCWESQLPVASKANITRMYNNFRNQLAKTENLNSAMKMNWHWVLESEALKIISSCPTEDLHEYKFQRNIDGLDNFLICEYIVATFYLENPSQQNFLNDFPNLLRSNLARDFDKDNKFRRASVLHFGCALTTSNSSNLANYFVCVYCSKEASLSHTSDNCLKYAVKTENFSEFQHLCHAPKYIDLYGCEPKKMCDSFPPEIWTKSTPGELEQFYLVTEQETWFVINRTIYESDNALGIEKSDLTFTKPSGSSWLFNYNSFSEFCCIYDEETMQLLTAAPGSILEKNKRRFKREVDKTTKILQYSAIDPDYDYYPTCCIYLFVLNLILFVGLIVLARFTYVHYKSKTAT